jgi:DNA-binding MarR family transcriptional regulator
MPPASQSGLSAVHTSEEILAHPRFALARAAFIDAVLAFHEGDQFSSRLMVETMRQMAFNKIMALHFDQDVTDRSSWPTPGRVKDELARFALASPRRLDALLARLIHAGYVQSRPSEQDGRVRILTPTAKMMALDREWLVYNYVPLHVMFPDGYSEPITRDSAFQRAQRVIGREFAANAAAILAGHPAVMRFMHRDAGMLVLIKLIQISAGNRNGVSYTDLATRFGVSRTHVRSLLQDAEQHGNVSLSADGKRVVELKASLLTDFDRFLADAMSAHDAMYRLARERMGNR